MRILDKQKSTLPLTALDFSGANLTKYCEVIRQPYGMILHCGPTGSGKSVTLYSALNEISLSEIVINLLISSLHTNDAPGIIARLADMGVKPFMISSSLQCVRPAVDAPRLQDMPQAL